MIPSQKLGMDCPSMANVVTEPSQAVPRLMAASTPRGMASERAMSMEKSVNSITYEAQILDVERSIESEGPPSRLDLLQRSPFADEEVGGITSDLQGEEAHQRHADDDDDALDQSPQDVRAH